MILAGELRWAARQRKRALAALQHQPRAGARGAARAGGSRPGAPREEPRRVRARDRVRGSRRDLRTARGARRAGRPARGEAIARMRSSASWPCSTRWTPPRRPRTSSVPRATRFCTSTSAGRHRQHQARRHLQAPDQGAAPVPHARCDRAAAACGCRSTSTARSSRPSRPATPSAPAASCASTSRQPQAHAQGARAARRPRESHPMTQLYQRKGAQMTSRDHRSQRRTYRWMSRPVVVVCVDGCEPAYLEASCAGVAPFLARLIERRRMLAGLRGAFVHQSEQPVDRHRRAACRAWHLRQLLLDRDAGTEVMMNDPKYLRCGTLLAAFADAGAKVAVVTAKDKLRTLLGHKLKGTASPRRRPRPRGRERHRPCATGRHAGAVGVQRRAVGVRVCRGRQADGARPPGPDVPLDHRLRAAQGGAGRAGGKCVLRDDGPLSRAPGRAGLHHRAHRRPRHERQASTPTARPT